MAATLEYTTETKLMEEVENLKRNLEAAQKENAVLRGQCNMDISTIASLRNSLEALKREVDIATAKQAETNRWLAILELAMRAL